MKKLISQPRPQRFRYLPDITRTFARYIGRRLSAPERRIISVLEAKRLKGESARFLIIDFRPHHRAEPKSEAAENSDTSIPNSHLIKNDYGWHNSC